MPAQKHVLVTLGGTFGTGSDAEIWQVGIKMGSKDSSTPPNYVGVNLTDLTAYANSISAGVTTWFSASANMIRNDFKLTTIKVANIAVAVPGVGKKGEPTGVYGKYAGATDEHGGPNPAVLTVSALGGSNTTSPVNAAPQIITFAATFRNSAAPKGPRHAASHGRIYLPFNVSTTTDRQAVGTLTPYATSVATLLTALSKDNVTFTDLATTSIRPILVGRDGTVRGIDQVAIGDVVDTVRRRKDKLRENYNTIAWS